VLVSPCDAIVGSCGTIKGTELMQIKGFPYTLQKLLYWPQAHNDVVQKLLRKVRKGARMIYVSGNHDEFARGYIGSVFGGVEVAVRDDFGAERANPAAVVALVNAQKKLYFNVSTRFVAIP
jgi:phosphatidylserine decarboxylase